MRFFPDLLVMLLLAVLYGCGIGGGGLLVVYLTLVRGVSQGDAQALNLFFYIVASSASALLLMRRRTVNLRLVLLCSLAGIPGVAFGSLLRRVLSVTLLRRIFGGMLILTGASVFLAKRKKEEEPPHSPR